MRHWVRSGLALGLLLVLSLAAGPALAAWEDTAGHWAEERIDRWTREQLISGFEDGTFRPEEEVTRAQLVALAYRAFDLELQDGEDLQAFADVDEDDWYYPHLQAAVAADWISGYEDGTFRPNQTINRAETATLLRSVLELEAPGEQEALAGFADAGDIPEWAREDVAAVTQAGLLSGYPDQTFGPERELSRAEAVTALDRALDRQRELPGTIQDWVEGSRKLMAAQAREYQGELYLLVTYGEQPTGGYAVDIFDVEEDGDQLRVHVEFTQPEPGEPVTQAITYPYDLKVTDPTQREVVFEAHGDEDYVPGLLGLERLRPIVAHSRGIAVFEPAPETQVSRRFQVEGVANVFEGNVQYELKDARDQVLDEGFTTGAMGDWGHFAADLEVPEEVDSGEEMLLELYTISAKDGSVEDLVEIDLVLE